MTEKKRYTARSRVRKQYIGEDSRIKLTKEPANTGAPFGPGQEVIIADVDDAGLNILIQLVDELKTLRDTDPERVVQDLRLGLVDIVDTNGELEEYEEVLLDALKRSSIDPIALVEFEIYKQSRRKKFKKVEKLVHAYIEAVETGNYVS